MAKKKISKTEQKLRSELRADQIRLKKLESDVSENWKFGTEGAGKKALEINKRISEKKKSLERFGYKGQKEINWRARAERSKIDESFDFGKAWNKKDAESEIFQVIKPDSVNGKSLSGDLNSAISQFNKLYLKMTSKNSLRGKLTIGGDLFLYVVGENEDDESEDDF